MTANRKPPEKKIVIVMKEVMGLIADYGDAPTAAYAPVPMCRFDDTQSAEAWVDSSGADGQTYLVVTVQRKLRVKEVRQRTMELIPL